MISIENSNLNYRLISDISRSNSPKSFSFQNSSLESNKKMKEYGIIGDTVSILNLGNLGFEASFFVMIRISEQDLRWQENS